MPNPKRTGAPDGRWARHRARRRARKLAKKRRLAALSRKRRVARRVGLLATWCLGALALLLVVTAVAFYQLSKVPSPESLPLPQVATITYSDGATLARLADDGQDRTLVTLAQVPVGVRYDVLAAEDRSFYTEPGVSIKGTLRAALSDATGGDEQGGSTITQQYAKNAYLSDERTLTRKLKELAIAVKLDRNYSKDQILEFYLNTVYFGRGAYGIQAAAQVYFGESVSRLDVAQGAVLAALLKAPSYYDPASNPAAAKARWQYVLDGMVATKHLTAAQEQATAYPKVKPVSTDDNGLGASGPTELIVQRVLAELQSDGISEDEIYARGLTIRTTIDQHAQQAAVSAITQTFAELTPQQRNLKNALVAVDPSTGGVLAYYGGPDGRDYAGQVDYNDYAGIGERPPGSSFKPYTLATVLTQTLKKTPGKPDLTIDSRVDGSTPQTIEGTVIHNDPGDDSVSSPSITIANAMKFSLNTAFDAMAAAAGPADVADTAHAAGIGKTLSDGSPSLVDADGSTSFGIGIGDYPVSPLDQADGYATFADNGKQHDAFFVQKVTASDGQTVYTHQVTGSQALDPKVANDVTLTLEPIAASSGDPLDGGRVSAAKTGTEGIQSSGDNDSDAWMVGYTPQVSAAVWVGSGNSVIPIYNAYGAPEYGSDLPGKAWARFMDAYLADTPVAPMATTQQITGGQDTAPSPSPTPSPSSPSRTPSHTATPTPTPSARTSSPTPTPGPSGSGSSSGSPSPSPSPSCTLLLGIGCSGATTPPG